MVRGMTVKKRSLIIRILSAVVILAVVIVFFATRTESVNYLEKYEGYDLTATDNGRTNTYDMYLANHAGASYPQKTVEIDVLSYDAEASYGVSALDSSYGAENAVLTEEQSFLQYAFNVEESGFYNILLGYYPIESRAIDMERKLYINGVMPFSGADALTFRRIWTDSAVGVKVDNQGNQIRPSQVEAPRWENIYVSDYMGYELEPYRFYFEKGENTIAFEAISEPMAIKTIEIKPVIEYKPYIEYVKSFNEQDYTGGNDFIDKIQGESAQHRSSPSLYALFDRSSGTTEPYSVTSSVLNIIGGQSWRVAGQWIEWDFEVPDSGMYRVSVKARQNYNREIVSNRSVYIDGEIPCEEYSVVPFTYSTGWEMMTIQDKDGNDIYIPLEKGKHTIKMEINLGQLSEILTDIEESIYRLNQIYLKILVITGATPDQYRDYRLTEIHPDLVSNLKQEGRILYKIIDDIVAYTGRMGAEAAALQKLAIQLDNFVEKPHEIAKSLQGFKDNISAMGNSIMNLTNSQLDIDYIVVSGKNTELPAAGDNFLSSAAHEIKSFVASFFVDYNTLGDVYMNNEAIEAWMLSGRDQSIILKKLIDDDYTPKTGNNVNVKLVDGGTLMPAVVTGVGPDVVLTVGNADPVNYAIRDASVDLKQFEGFDEAVKDFLPSSLVPYEYNGGVYGLPETINFNVMFYREDIFANLGIEIPDTWEDLIKIIPIIQKQNMTVGMPSIDRQIGGASNPDMSGFFVQLFQNSGSLYDETGSKTLLDNENAVKAFEAYTKFFTHYKCPLIYDFGNRFRTGEMPIGFVDYNTFNTLIVLAPEIRGLWSMSILPGTLKEDGTIDRSTSMWGQAAMMLADNKDQYASWQFLSWWVSSSAQTGYGRELESVLGSAARYATANMAAFEQLSWSAENYKVLKEQWDWVVGVPEVPGGYYTGRYIVNAARRVINLSEDTRETLLDFTRTINEELSKKRAEFGLD